MPPPFTIDVNSPSPTEVISAYPTNEQQSRSAIYAWLDWLSDPVTGFIRPEAVELASLPDGAVILPTGTKMLFVQTAAPTGWVKDTTHDNKALRLVSGTAGAGGTTAFTTVFASRTPAGTVATHALSWNEMPVHAHGPGNLQGPTSGAGGHTHSYNLGRALDGGTTSGDPYIGRGQAAFVTGPHTSQINGVGDHAHYTYINAGATDAAGSGWGHAHGWTGAAMDFAVAYVDAIIATKS